MKRRIFWLIPVLAALGSADLNDYNSIKRKIDDIESDRAKPGSRIAMTPKEITAYAEQQLPEGVRNPELRLAPGRAIGTAMVDFAKLRRGQGQQPGWLLSRLLEGERPVTVTARVQSSRGRATVDVEKVAISGLEIDGDALDFMIQNFFLPLYPDAAVGRPFELGHRIERVDVQPAAIHVVIQ